MIAIKLKMSLLQEVTPLRGKKLIRKVLNNVHHMKMAAFGKATPVKKSVDNYVEPTREGILVGLRDALRDVKDLRRGKDVRYRFRDLSELFNKVWDKNPSRLR